MAKRPNMTDDELDQKIKEILDDTGTIPSINQLMAVCPCGRVRIQQRLAHWREEEATKVIQVADIPGDVRNALMLALDRALSGVILRERQLAQEAYAGKWVSVQADIADTNAAFAEMEKQNQLLQNENDRLSAELKLINENLLMKTGESQNLKSQLEAAQEEKSQVLADLAIAKSRTEELGTLNETLSKQVKELDRLTEARDAAERREKQATQTAERALTECAIAQEQNRQLQAERDLLQSKLAGLETLRTDYALAKDEINRLRSLLYAKKKGDQGQREQGQQQKQRPPRIQRPESRQQEGEGQAAPAQEKPNQDNGSISSILESEKQQETHTITGTRILDPAQGIE